MKLNFYHIVLLLCMPLGMFGQETDSQKLQFYTELALKDAAYERTFQSTLEDESDYWKDQRVFEKKLYRLNSEAHKAYLNGKHVAYGQHQKRCSTDCQHSDLYLRQASYYAVNGTFDIPSKMQLSSENTTRQGVNTIPRD